MRKLMVVTLGLMLFGGAVATAMSADNAFVARDFEAKFKVDGQNINDEAGNKIIGTYNGPNSTSEGSIAEVKGAAGTQAFHILWNKQDWAGAGFDLPKGIVTSDYKSIRFMVKGANSGLKWRLHLNDTGSEQLTTEIEDNSDSWRTIVLKLADFVHRPDWQPDGSDNNEVMDFPLGSVTLESYDGGEYDMWFDQFEFLK